MQGRILVTGASGFIGSHLVERLVAESANVRVAVRSNSRKAFLTAQPVQRAYIDYRDASTIHSALEGIDVVIHLAGLVAGSLTELLTANQETTQALVAQCAAQPKPPTVVIVSSLAAAGPSTCERPRKTLDPANPVSNYGRSKLQAEIAARKFADVVPLTILRPGIVFGPRDTEVVRLLEPIRMLGIVPIVGGHDSPLSFIHVEDVVSVIQKAIACGRRVKASTSETQLNSDGVYFVADQQPMKLSEMGNMLAPIWGWRRCRPLNVPAAAARLAARGGETMGKLRGKPSTFNLDKIREAVAPAWTCDCTTTRTELDWEPTKPLSERLIEFATDYAHRVSATRTAKRTAG